MFNVLGCIPTKVYILLVGSYHVCHIIITRQQTHFNTGTNCWFPILFPTTLPGGAKQLVRLIMNIMQLKLQKCFSSMNLKANFPYMNSSTEISLVNISINGQNMVELSLSPELRVAYHLFKAEYISTKLMAILEILSNIAHCSPLEKTVMIPGKYISKL